MKMILPTHNFPIVNIVVLPGEHTLHAIKLGSKSLIDEGNFGEFHTENEKAIRLMEETNPDLWEFVKKKLLWKNTDKFAWTMKVPLLLGGVISPN